MNNEFLQAAIEAAKAARDVILPFYRSNLNIELKSDRSPVTEADRAAEVCIRNILLERFPGHGMYGEEYGSINPDAEYLWLVDPIDGTKSFIQAYGFFSTQIALLHRGKLILGVSCAPAMNELAWAASGEGAWLNGDRLKVSDISRLGDATISSGNIQSLAGSDAWAAYGRITRQAGRTRGYGDFYHYHRLAAGQIDAVLESDVNILDIAALTVLVREAGGVVTTLDGAEIGIDSRSILAANPGLHASLSARLAGADKDA
jgi:histidinol-phosphatase